MHRSVPCIVIFVPLLGGIALVALAVLLVIVFLTLDPDGLGPMPLDQVPWDVVATYTVPLVLVGALGVTLGMINLMRGRVPK